jgi:SAM-dependent MidA family methyltransferase
MSEALYHPGSGYYNRADLERWGKNGDYRTSPERSELFAATFARYFVSLHRQMGHPAELVIVEMGGGAGHFARGVLQTLKENYSSVFQSTRYVLIEISEDARRRAAEALHNFGNVTFVTAAELKPSAQMVVFSNELIDAFPVHRITKVNGELKELYVGFSGDSKFNWVVDDLSSGLLTEFCNKNLPGITEGQIVEINVEVERWFQLLNQTVESGHIITVDYGSESDDLYDPARRKHGTLRAFRRHQFVDNVFDSPGECDLTTTVDWTLIKSVGERHGFRVEEFDQLDKFLMRAGILQELEERLAKATSDAEKAQLTTAAREMILPGGMASGFQVLVQRR